MQILNRLQLLHEAVFLENLLSSYFKLILPGNCTYSRRMKIMIINMVAGRQKNKGCPVSCMAENVKETDLTPEVP